MKTSLKALAASLLLSSSAFAADVTLTGWAYGVTGFGNEVSTSLYSGGAGAFYGSLSSPILTTSSFTTYCIEIDEHFSFSDQPMTGYTVVPGLTYFGSQAKVDTLGRLVTYTLTNPVTSAAQSTSFQLAIWNTIYDTDSSLSSGSFTDSSPFAQQATAYLQASAGLSSAVTVYALQKAGSQDFLLTTLNPAIVRPPIPEPAASALLVAGLCLIGCLKLRK